MRLVCRYILVICGALCAAPMSFAHGDNQTPSSQEISPAQWRREQLAAADKSDQIMQRAQRLPSLLGQYIVMQQTYDSNDSRAFRLIFGQYLSWFQTWIGDYDGARKSFSIAQKAQADDAPSPLDGTYTMRRADQTILELARGHRAIFFNESHSAPVTRTLTVEMLAKLRAEGFNYFAAETLYPTDRDLRKRGYPNPKTGFYTQEPIYAEMVRAALKLGYTVIAYDAESAGLGDARERGGAESLNNQVFKRDPSARLVVNAGFAHIQKSGIYLGGSSMGEFFQKISGIEPLVVEQTMMIQHAREDQDHPYYLAASRARHPDRPYVFVNSLGKAWSLKPTQYDVSVFFPPQLEVEGRPTWPGLDGTRMTYSVSGDICHHQFPCLIEARYNDEGDDAIPADRLALNIVDLNAPMDQRVLTAHGTAQSRLYLYPGKYRLSASDAAGRALSSSSITVGMRPNADSDDASSLQN